MSNPRLDMMAKCAPQVASTDPLLFGTIYLVGTLVIIIIFADHLLCILSVMVVPIKEHHQNQMWFQPSQFWSSCGSFVCIWEALKGKLPCNSCYCCWDHNLDKDPDLPWWPLDIWPISLADISSNDFKWCELYYPQNSLLGHTLLHSKSSSNGQEFEQRISPEAYFSFTRFSPGCNESNLEIVAAS